MGRLVDQFFFGVEEEAIFGYGGGRLLEDFEAGRGSGEFSLIKSFPFQRLGQYQGSCSARNWFMFLKFYEF